MWRKSRFKVHTRTPAPDESDVNFLHSIHAAIRRSLPAPEFVTLLPNPYIYTPILVIGGLTHTAVAFKGDVLTLSIEGRETDLRGNIMDPYPGEEFLGRFGTIIFAGCCPVSNAAGVGHGTQYVPIDSFALAERVAALLRGDGQVYIQDCNYHLRPQRPHINQERRRHFLAAFVANGFIDVTPYSSTIINSFMPFSAIYRRAPGSEQHRFDPADLDEDRWTSIQGALKLQYIASAPRVPIRPTQKM